MNDVSIQPVRVSEHVTWFYWGRHPRHANIDMRLGGGAHAIHDGDAALLVDTMNLPGQGAWVRRHLHRSLGIRDLRVVNTHWHPDHVADNHCFADVPILGHRATRDRMEAHRAELEEGIWPGCPPLRVAPPTETFEGRMELKVGALTVELLEFGIHETGHIGVYIRDERTLIAGDMLEDPIWIFHFDFAAPERQLAEYRRMAAMEIDRILPTHGSPAIVARGGYDRSLIHHNASYLKRMLADAGDPDFASREAPHYIADALAAGELEWWEPYAEVHELNRRSIAELCSSPRSGGSCR